jgi:hypothetical protein
MRRESSTVVVLVGEVTDGLLAGLSRSANVSVARTPAAGADRPADPAPAAARPGWETGALALREAARRQSTYAASPKASAPAARPSRRGIACRARLLPLPALHATANADGRCAARGR